MSRFLPPKIYIIALCIVAATGCQLQSAQTPVDQLQEAGEGAAALLGQVRSAAQEARYALAIELADSLIGLAPNLPQAYYERGLLLVQLRQLEAADSDLEAATVLDPHHRGAWYQRGHVAFEQRDYREAIARYEQQRQVIEQSPRSLQTFYEETDQLALPQIWLQVGRSYELMNVADSAKWAYTHVLRLDSTRAQAHAWLSQLLKAEGDLKSALQHSQKALYYNNGNPEFAYQLGMLYFENGDLEEAIPLLDRVVVQQPWNASAHYNLGRSLVGSGRMQEGQEHLDQVEHLQNLEQNIEYARAAIARFPDDPGRWRQLSQLLGQAGRVQEQQHIHRVILGLSELDETVQSGSQP